MVSLINNNLWTPSMIRCTVYHLIELLQAVSASRLQLVIWKSNRKRPKLTIKPVGKIVTSSSKCLKTSVLAARSRDWVQSSRDRAHAHLWPSRIMLATEIILLVDASRIPSLHELIHLSQVQTMKKREASSMPIKAYHMLRRSLGVRLPMIMQEWRKECKCWIQSDHRRPHVSTLIESSLMQLTFIRLTTKEQAVETPYSILIAAMATRSRIGIKQVHAP